jgi:hypothetical protein
MCFDRNINGNRDVKFLIGIIGHCTDPRKLHDSDSASVSALTPLSVSPPPPGYNNSAPVEDDIICLSD